MGALSEQELAAFSADFNKNDKNKSAINLSVLKYDFPGLTKKEALYIALNEYNKAVKRKLIKFFSRSWSNLLNLLHNFILNNHLKGVDRYWS